MLPLEPCAWGGPPTHFLLTATLDMVLLNKLLMLQYRSKCFGVRNFLFNKPLFY
jgi:hypothetical protein